MPPAAWQPHLRQLVEASRAPVEGPRWWTPSNAYFGNVETRTDPQAYRWDGMRRLGPRARPLVIFQLTLAGGVTTIGPVTATCLAMRRKT